MLTQTRVKKNGKYRTMWVTDGREHVLVRMLLIVPRGHLSRQAYRKRYMPIEQDVQLFEDIEQVRQSDEQAVHSLFMMIG